MVSLPAKVDKVIQDYLSKLLAVCQNNISGVYLTGSVPPGDYYSKKSDIDFITVFQELPGMNLIHQLKSIHHHIERTHNYPKLNGYYVSASGLASNQLSYPSFFKNKMYVERKLELIHFSLLELKYFSQRIYGIPADQLPLRVELEEVMKELQQNINSYWTGWVQKHSGLSIHRMLLLVFPRLTEWGVLGVARQLYTLETGAVTTKLGAGIFYLDKLPEEFKQIMATAISTRRLNKTEFMPSRKRANDTLNCMNWMILAFNERYHTKLSGC